MRTEWNLPPGVTSKMIDEMYKEPEEFWAVRILEHGKWKLWDEFQTERRAILEAERLEDEGYAVRIEEV